MIRKCIYLVSVLLLMVAGGCKKPDIAKADAQYKRGEYYEAANTYRKVYNKLKPREDRELRGRVAYQMGTCYRRLNMAARASAAYQNAIRYEYPDSTSWYWLGRSLQMEGKYQPAIEAYTKFLDYQPDDLLAKEGINGCRRAVAAKSGKKTRYQVKPAKLFNSRRSDFAPMFGNKELSMLYFSSTNEKAVGTTKSEVTGTKRADIFVSRKDEKGNWQRPEPVEGELNTEMEEGIVSFSPDGQTMYLTVAKVNPNADSSVDIYTSRRSDASWSAPVKFEVISDTISAIGHPAVSPSGTYLYFSSDMPGGFGGKDIWRINLNDRAGSLENLGPQINTPGDEMFPYMRTDSLLYFSSDGHPGFGGLDLFTGRLNATGEFWSVENMGIPMNSQGDDFGITYGEGESGFFSSNRGDARGYDHIYSFVKPDIVVTISGMVMDKDEEPVPDAVIRIVGDDGSNQKEVARDDGSFKFKLNRGVRYVMMAGAKGYLNVKQEFESDPEEADAEYGIDFMLAAVHKPQVVENIFYDFNRATLRPESKAALDSLATLLRDNPTVSLEMSAHTDRVGTEEYNLDLSDRRARSVVEYLIGVGIEPERLTWKGYGESVPKTVTKRISREYPQFEEGTVLNEEYVLTLSDEDREAADQINRRTEFQVTGL